MLVASGIALSAFHLHNEVKLYGNGNSVSSSHSYSDCLLCDAVFQIHDNTENDSFVFFTSENVLAETSPRLDSHLSIINRDDRAPPFQLS